MKRLENCKKIVFIQKQISELPFQLIQPNRVFLEQADFLMVENGKKRRKKCWLFSDILLYASYRTFRSLKYKGFVSLKKIRVEDFGKMLELFDLEHFKPLYLCFSSEEVKKKWLLLLKERILFYKKRQDTLDKHTSNFF